MSAAPCSFYLKNACQRGTSCTFSHQKPVSGTKPPRSPGICHYFLKGKCAFGDGCIRSHGGERKKANADNGYNEESSSSYESPAENSGTIRSDKGSIGGYEYIQGNVQDSPAGGDDLLDPPTSKEIDIDEESAEPEVQDSPSQNESDDVLNPPLSNIKEVNVDRESTDKDPCIFFPEGTCRNGDACDFSHSLLGDAETRSSSCQEPPRLKSSYTPKPSVSSREKTCKIFLQGRCQLEDDCASLHTQSWKAKPSIKVSDTSTDTSTDLSCCLDSPFDGPNGEEDDNTSLEYRACEIEGGSIDNVVHGDTRDKMDLAPWHHNGINENHPDTDQPKYGDDESYQEQPSEGDTANQVVGEAVETYPNHVEPVDKHFKVSKPSSYYGDGWEERSSPSPLATRLQERQRVVLPVIPLPSPAPSPASPAPSPASPAPSPASPASPPAPAPAPPTYPHISEITPHWTQFADPHAQKDVPFCKRLAQGGCSQADGCRFRHSLTVKEYILLFNDQQPNLWTLQRGGVDEPTASSPVSTQPQVNLLHGQPSTVVVGSSTFGQECKFYPIGKCRNGDLCPFQHTQHAEVSAATVSNVNYAAERPAFGTQNAQRPCKYYAERGYCSWGISCKFRHGDHPDGDHPSSGPSGPESTPSVVDDDKGWSTGWEEGHKVNNNNSNVDTPAEDNGWGPVAATVWDTPSKSEDYSAWDNPSGNDDSYKPRPRGSKVCFQYVKGLCHRDPCRFSHDQEITDKRLSSEAPKADDGGWPPADDSSHSAPWSTAIPTQCSYHLKGNCRNGSFCRMSHDSEKKPQEESQPEVSYNPDKLTNESGNKPYNEVQSTWETERESKTWDENQPMVQEDSQDSHVVDNEATWSQPWPTETVQPPTFPIKIDAPCMRFGQGYCPFGDECSYLHIEETDMAEYTSNSEENVSKTPLANDEVVESGSVIPDSSKAVHEPIVFDHPVVERHILNCTVRFGIDATPDQITTAADSKKLILSNLPVDVSPTVIKELAGPFGDIHSIISLGETAHTARIEVEFAESSQALTAFRDLNGQSFEKLTISANLKGRVSMTVRSPEHTHVVRVSWPAPSASAWIHYTAISKAKSEATRLDGVIIGGLQVKAVYVPPLKRQKDSFAVEVRGLPVDVSKGVLKDLCPEQSFITMNPPCYTQDPTEAIRSALARCGELEDIDIPSTSTTRLASVAFVTFKSGEKTLEAMEALNGQKQDFLGGQPLSVQSIYYFRHRTTIPQFEAVKNEIDRLIQKGEKKCSIQCQEQSQRRVVWIRIHASVENLAIFASLNTELAALFRGMLLISNGDAVWDDYLETSSSTKSIDTINATNNEGPFFVQCDIRTRNVRIFGGKSDQERAKSLVMRMLQKVRKLQHEIQLPRTKLHELVNGGLKALQDDLGVNKVSLDVANAKLIVRGSSAEHSNAEDSIGSLDPLSIPETTEALCQICHHLPIDPIPLICRHAYCTLCLQMALRYSPNAPFQCISRHTTENGLTIQCPENVPYIIIRDTLQCAEENAFLHASFLSYIRLKSEEFFFCPTLDCQSAYRTGVEGLTLRCPSCVSELCTFCQTRAHVGSACSGRSDIT